MGLPHLFYLLWNKMRTPTAFERERAEGEGAFFGRSIASEKKVRRPVKRERTRQSHPGKEPLRWLFCYIAIKILHN